MRFVVHDAPALRAESNYISRVDLTPFGSPGVFEQVFMREIGGDLFELCCIPFRAYGLALRDVLRVLPDGTLAYELVSQSGRQVLRALLSEGRGRLNKAAGGKVEEACRAAQLLYEWNGPRHIAIDIPPHADFSSVEALLRGEVESHSAQWEWADSESFQVPVY